MVPLLLKKSKGISAAGCGRGFGKVRMDRLTSRDYSRGIHMQQQQLVASECEKEDLLMKVSGMVKITLVYIVMIH